MKNLHIKRKEAEFAVPSAFVDRYMAEADECALKVYLYLLRHCDCAELDGAAVAKALGVTESKVMKAISYWNDISVLRFTDNDDECSLEFLPLTAYSVPAAVETAENEDDKKFSSGTMPKYFVKDINAALKADKTVGDMFLIAEQLLCKPLNHNDMKILYSFHDWLKLPSDVIVMLLEYCTSLNKMDLRYIEKVALTWADNGIDDFEKANIYIKGQAKLARQEKKVKRILQISGRDLTETETKFVRSWLTECKATEAKIKEAYEITVMNTGKMNFKYMDAVLKNLGKDTKPTKTVPKKKNNFTNFGGDDGMNEFEKKMLIRRVNGEG